MSYLDQNDIDRDLSLYDMGRSLRAVVHTPGWEIVLDTLKSYKDQAVEDLVALAPGDPTVPTVHAAASALSDQFSKFQQDIDRAIEFAANPPEALQEYLVGVRDDSDVLKAMAKANTPRRDV